MAFTMENCTPQTDFVVQSDNNNDGRHHNPRRHPRFSVMQKQQSHRRISLFPSRQLPSMRWSTLGDMPPDDDDDDVRSSMTATNDGNSSMIDQSTAVESYFESIRVPASFLLATSFSELFGMTVNHDDTFIQQQLQKYCVLFQFITFVLSMNVIILSTQALLRALTGDFDPFAETGYEFLFREFHYEFCLCRWSFQVSLYGFLMAVTFKMLYAFELFNVEGENFEREYLELGIGVCLIMASLLIHLSSYVNSSMVGWKNMTDMTIDLLKMIYYRGRNLGHKIDSFALLMGLVGVVFIVLSLIPGVQI